MKHAILALLLLTMPAAFAQTPAPDAQGPPQPQFSDLAAMQHHQPTRAEVNDREKAAEGAATVDARNKQEQKEVDHLYQQLIGRPANDK